MNTAAIIINTLLLFAFSLGNAEAGTKKFHQTFDVTPGGKLIVNADFGSLRIVGTSENVVSVKADIKGRDEDIARFEITAEQHGNKVVIRGIEHRSWFFNRSSNLHAVFTIQVPYQFDLRLNNSGGNVSIDTINGTISGKTSLGNIEMNGIEGEVKFSTSGGNTNIRKSLGRLYIDNSMGDITLTEFVGDIKVSTSGGNVKVNDVQGGVHAETSMGHVIIKGIRENKGIYAETSGGNIRIEVQKNISANIDVDAQALGGGVRCDLPVLMSGKFDRGRISGTINGGGPLIYARTSMGHIRIIGVE